MEVSSLGGDSAAGWPWGLQEPDAWLLMTWKRPSLLKHSWKGVLLTCLPTVRTRTRKKKGTDRKASVSSKTETPLPESGTSGLGYGAVSGSVRSAVRFQWSCCNSDLSQASGV